MNIPNIIAPVRADLSVTSFKTEKDNLLLKIAKIIEPKAPTPAASVGVANPANIEPKTNNIRPMGGKPPRKPNNRPLDRLSAGWALDHFE